MQRWYIRLACALGIAALSGCANWNAVKKDFVLKDGASVSIDAKQRVVFSSKEVICAEPSPDALSALAANLGVDAAVAAKSLGLTYGTQEGAASIGLRTQTIQTLRDAMYRLCEGYAGGALDDIGFVRLQRRYQAVMLGLLAIEQLTGATVANQASIGGSGSARLGSSFGQVSALITDTRQKQLVAQASSAQKGEVVEAKKKAVVAAEAALKKATTDAAGQETQALKDARAAQSDRSAELATAEEELAKAKQAAALATADLESLEQLRKEMDRASAVTAASAQLSGASNVATGPSNAEAAMRVAEAVERIVTTIVSHDYSKEACLDWMLSRSMRDSFSAGSKRDLSMLQFQIEACVQERTLIQELALAKVRADADVAMAKLRPAVDVKVVPDPSDTVTAKVTVKPGATRGAAKSASSPRPPATAKAQEPSTSIAVTTPPPQSTAAAASGPVLTTVPAQSRLEPASAAERLVKILENAKGEEATQKAAPK